MAEGKDTGGAVRGSSSGKGGLRFTVGIRSYSGFRSAGRLHGDRRGVCSSPGVGFFFNANETLIRNFPAEVSVLAALLEMLLKEDGAAGISDENSGSRQQNIASAILHFHTPTKKGRVAGHTVPSFVIC